MAGYASVKFPKPGSAGLSLILAVNTVAASCKM